MNNFMQGAFSYSPPHSKRKTDTSLVKYQGWLNARNSQTYFRRSVGGPEPEISGTGTPPKQSDEILLFDDQNSFIKNMKMKPRFESIIKHKIDVSRKSNQQSQQTSRARIFPE